MNWCGGGWRECDLRRTRDEWTVERGHLGKAGRFAQSRKPEGLSHSRQQVRGCHQTEYGTVASPAGASQQLIVVRALGALPHLNDMLTNCPHSNNFFHHCMLDASAASSRQCSTGRYSRV